MAYSQISAGKIKAYRDTTYRCGLGPNVITLRIDTRSEELARLYAAHGLACAAFITACNPSGQLQSLEANEAAHARLGAEIKALEREFIEGAGVDPTGDWPEERSYLALGVGLDSAKNIGIFYGQDAVVWMGEDAVPRLILLR